MIRLSTRKRYKHGPDDKIIPLINVIFLLLMFFLIAGNLTHMAAQDFVPPRSASDEHGRSEQPPLVLRADGSLYWEARKLTAAEVLNRLRAQGGVPLRMRIHVDARTRTAQLLPVMAALRQGGVATLSIVTVRPSGTP